MSTAQSDDAAIREQAYYFWEQDGRPHGRETEYWMRAKLAVRERGRIDAPVEPTRSTAARPQAAASKSSPLISKAGPARKPKKK